MRRASGRRTLIALITSIALSLSATIAFADSGYLRLPDMGDPAAQYLSAAQERALGREMMREVRNHLPMMTDHQLNAYIRDLGQRLASHSNATDQSFHFFVVDHHSINAFAMPGGYIGIHRGLILAAQSESELAAVVAHEIAHVTQRHIARSFGEAQRLNARTAAILLASLALASQDPEAGSAAAMAGIAGGVQQQLSFSREHEHEADRVGMRILTAAGFDPQGMPDVFTRLHQAAQYHGQPPEWLSTHPLTSNRIADSQARARQTPSSNVFESDRFELMRARLRVLQARSPADAVAYFEQRLEQSDTVSARYGLALALTAAGDRERAADILAALPDDDVAVLLARADLARRGGQLEAALAIYERAGQLFPSDDAVALQHAEALLAADQPEQARRLLARTVRGGSDDPHHHWLLAQAANEAGAQVAARLALTEYYYLLGDLSAALSQLDQIMDDPNADHYQVARASARADNVRQALRDRQQAR